MISSRPDLLLYIEPRGPESDEPLVDELTRKMTAALRAARHGDLFWCGMHRFVCGAFSECQDYVLPSGMQTNSLCVHYLAHHRPEVPTSELDKVARLAHGDAEPTEMELRGRREGR